MTLLMSHQQQANDMRLIMTCLPPLPPARLLGTRVRSTWGNCAFPWLNHIQQYLVLSYIGMHLAGTRAALDISGCFERTGGEGDLPQRKPSERGSNRRRGRQDRGGNEDHDDAAQSVPSTNAPPPGTLSCLVCPYPIFPQAACYLRKRCQTTVIMAQVDIRR